MASTKQMQARARQQKLLLKQSKLNNEREQNDTHIMNTLTPYIKKMAENTKQKINQSYKRYQERFGKRCPINFQTMSLEETVPYMAMFKMEYVDVQMPDITDKKVHKEFSDHTQSLGIYAGETLVGFVKFNLLEATRNIEGKNVDYKLAMIDVIHIFKEYRNYGIASHVYETVMDNENLGEALLRGHTPQAVNIQAQRVIKNPAYWIHMGLGRMQKHPVHADMVYLKTGYQTTTSSRSITPLLTFLALDLYRDDDNRRVDTTLMAMWLANSAFGEVVSDVLEREAM